jgi:hypothetical protein
LNRAAAHPDPCRNVFSGQRDRLPTSQTYARLCSSPSRPTPPPPDRKRGSAPHVQLRNDQRRNR